MKILNRQNEYEDCRLDAITERIRKACSYCDDLDSIIVDPVMISTKVCPQIVDGITTKELDNITVNICMNLSLQHPQFGILGSRIAVNNHKKNVNMSFTEAMNMLYNYVDVKGNSSPKVNKKFIDIVNKYSQEFENMIVEDRDYNIDFFGFKTLERAYLLKNDDRILETAQFMWLRVSIGMWYDNLDKVKNTYNLLSTKFFTHATPTLFNCGTSLNNCISCFLLGTEDSVKGIFKTISDCADISKVAGGIGIHISNIRTNKSYVRGTGGASDGVLPMLKVYNETAKYINQGNKRKGSFALYTEPWSADIFIFLDAKRNHGNEEERARDLFYALWIPDLFMKTVENDGDWYLMCPDECPGLPDTYGKKFEELYNSYITQGKYRQKIKARKLWDKILDVQLETGMPYMCYKDAANKKTNQKNIGTIKSSNLCVAPETRILTKQGYYKIKECKDKEVEVWNGEEWSKTIVKQTGTNQKLIQLKFSNGTELNCTEYHKFYIETGSRPADKSKPVIVEAQNLKIGMKLIKFNLGQVEDNKKIFKYAYTSGIHSADGTYNIINNGKKRPLLSLYGDKKKLIDYIDIRSSSYKSDRINISLPHDLPNKFEVPINYSLKSKLEWLAGYFDGDGCVEKNGENQSLQAASIHFDFLNDIKLMLQTLGINSKVTLNKVAGKTILPDGKGGKKHFDCKEIHRILINSVETQKLLDMGLKTNRLIIKNHEPNREANHFITVVGINDIERCDDTYCFKEEKKGMGMFEGILTGNCSEIMLYSDKDEYACCNLVSLRLQSFVVSSKNVSEFRESQIKVYTKKDCGFCKMTKALFVKNNIKYSEISLDDDELRTLFYEKYKVNTVPQIFINKEKIGGFDEILDKLKPDYDFQTLRETVYTCVENLNKIIDINYYPCPETKNSNFKNRPIGIGVQGLANVFIEMWEPYDSEFSRKLNRDIFETIYYASLEKSCEMAKEYGAYSTYKGSPIDNGIFQFDMWGIEPTDRWDWKTLRENIKLHGVRNSTTVALMPTASTSQILGSEECFQPITSNMYLRRTLAGEFIVINNELMNILYNMGIWDEEMKYRIMFHKGSIKNIHSIPKNIRDMFKTAWEISQKSLIEMAADRGAYVCQSQSFNIFIDKSDPNKLTKIHFKGWKSGLKTGSYYIHSKPATSSQNFTIEPNMEELFKKELLENNFEDCEACGS